MKNVEDALKVIIQRIKDPSPSEYSNYGYDIFLPNLIRDYSRTTEARGMFDIEQRVKELSPLFLAASWELCRRGIIRPGVKMLGAQATSEGSGGAGFSITPFGLSWLSESQHDYIVPTEPERFARMMSPFIDKLGIGFKERSQEAIRCYGAHAYLACCTMCGAAAESILLALAVKKTDKDKVLSIYKTANGRARVENLIIGKVREQLQKEFRGYLILLKYWRDEASHGHSSGITDDEAYTSLAILLRFAHYVNDNWGELTKTHSEIS